MTTRNNAKRPLTSASTSKTPGDPHPSAHRIEEMVTPDRIRSRAYELFLERNPGSGDELSDWLQAESELCEACNQASRKSAAPVIEVQARSIAAVRARR